MNVPFTISGALMVLTVGIHVFAGGPEYFREFLTNLQTAHLASMSAVLWHAITVNLMVFAGVYFWLSRRSNAALTITIGVMQLGWAALFLYYGVTMLNTIWLMPQWVIFIVIPLLSLYGLRKAEDG